MSKSNVVVNGNSYDCDIYISASGRVVSEIILYTVVQAEDGDIRLGAYYGSVGGGENDGGFFRMDIESSTSECLDYDEVDDLEEENPLHSSERNHRRFHHLQQTHSKHQAGCLHPPPEQLYIKLSHLPLYQMQKYKYRSHMNFHLLLHCF
jgi:hypothetical protein